MWRGSHADRLRAWEVDAVVIPRAPMPTAMDVFQMALSDLQRRWLLHAWAASCLVGMITVWPTCRNNLFRLFWLFMGLGRALALGFELAATGLRMSCDAARTSASLFDIMCSVLCTLVPAMASGSERTYDSYPPPHRASRHGGVRAVLCNFNPSTDARSTVLRASYTRPRRVRGVVFGLGAYPGRSTPYNPKNGHNLAHFL